MDPRYPPYPGYPPYGMQPPPAAPPPAPKGVSINWRATLIATAVVAAIVALSQLGNPMTASVFESLRSGEDGPSRFERTRYGEPHSERGYYAKRRCPKGSPGWYREQEEERRSKPVERYTDNPQSANMSRRTGFGETTIYYREY